MLERRGPNGQGKVTIHCSPYYVLLASSVLWTQGNIPCIQPRRRGESYLCWNGDLFEGSVVSTLILIKILLAVDCSGIKRSLELRKKME